MTGEIRQAVPNSPAIYFPFGYIEDNITFGMNGHERDLNLNWLDQHTVFRAWLVVGHTI